MTFEMLQREKYKEGVEYGKKLGERRGEKRGIGLGKLDAIRRMKERGFNFKMIMKAGYTKAEYKQALQTENQLIEK